MNVAMFKQYNPSENKNDIEFKIFVYSAVVGFLLIILLVMWWFVIFQLMKDQEKGF